MSDLGDADPGRLHEGVPGGAGGVLQAAGLLFFAFAGYARIATLGEEVRDPARTIPRAVRVSLAVTLAAYVAVAVAVLSVLGAESLGASVAPLADAVRAAGVPGLAPVVRVGAAVAALGSLLALLLGVSRTTLAMARDRHLPGPLAAVHPRFHVPHRAALAVGGVVAVLAAVVDVRGAVGFSSFGVLTYYAVANASAWTLRPGSRPGWCLNGGLRRVPDAGVLLALDLGGRGRGSARCGCGGVRSAERVGSAAGRSGRAVARPRVHDAWRRRGVCGAVDNGAVVDNGGVADNGGIVDNVPPVAPSPGRAAAQLTSGP